MGMFDYYVPVPAIECPTCRKPIETWQGKHSACSLFVWQQGEAIPVQDMLEHVPEYVARLRLPERFNFTASCCSWLFIGEGRCIDGIWKETSVKALPKEDPSSTIKILAAKYLPPTP